MLNNNDFIEKEGGEEMGKRRSVLNDSIENLFKLTFGELYNISDDELDEIFNKADKFQDDWIKVFFSSSNNINIDWIIIAREPYNIIRQGPDSEEPTSEQLEKIAKEEGVIIFCYSRPKIIESNRFKIKTPEKILVTK